MARSRSSKNFLVRLMTPKGKVFAGGVSAVEFMWPNGVLQLELDNVSYFGAVTSGELSLRIGKRFRFFTVVHAAASFENRRLTILAEVIEPTTAPVRNCSNPFCTCVTLTHDTAGFHPPTISHGR